MLVTYIMHIVHAVKSLQGPGVPPSYSLAGLNLSTAAHEWFSCQDQCLSRSPPVAPDSFGPAGPLWGEAVWGSQVSWDHHCFPLLLLQQEAAEQIYCCIVQSVLRWAGTTHFSLVTQEELHWQRSPRAGTFHGHTLEMSTLQKKCFLALGNSVAYRISNFAPKHTFRRILSCRGCERKDRYPLLCSALQTQSGPNWVDFHNFLAWCKRLFFCWTLQFESKYSALFQKVFNCTLQKLLLWKK